jgi:hypothetical protein
MILPESRREFMSRASRGLLVLSFPPLLACGLLNQAVAVTASPNVPPEPGASDTPTIPATVEATGTPAATIPPFLTSIPGIAATLTAVYSTPGVENTLAARQTTIAASQGVQLQGFSSSLLSQCPNPSDAPQQSWLDIPIMPQATAGQVVQTLVGSYYCFRAQVTAGEMETFYREKLQPPNWMMQADANGSLEFVGLGQAGMQLLFIVSGPGDQNDLLVAINATRPMSFPTSKP